jgi:amino acid transporter
MIPVRRPRNVDWRRGAALLYGDWGTSKAYVLGLGFALAGYASFPLILAMCFLTCVVGINYIWVCRNFPDGGGVFSCARPHSEVLAVVGALLLIAGYIVTASLSALEAFHYVADYLNLSHEQVVALTLIALAVLGGMNFFGPKHSGSMAILLAIPTVITVVILALASAPHLAEAHIEPTTSSGWTNWSNFVGVVLALSGVEAVANMTGVMKLDPGSTDDKPSIRIASSKTVIPVMIEVCLFTALLGWAMHAIPDMDRELHKEDMLRHMGEVFVSKWFGVVVGVVFALLLLSAANTAIVAMVAVIYMMARENDLPRLFGRLNPWGVPWLPLVIATLAPIWVLTIQSDLTDLAALYAVGVVGAIAITLGSTSLYRKADLRIWQRVFMFVTFVIMALIGLTLIVEKKNAFFFAASVLSVGLVAHLFHREFERKRGVSAVVARSAETLSLSQEKAAASILVAARGITPALRFAIEEARLRKATLYVLYVNEIAVQMLGQRTARWQDDAQASHIFGEVQKLAGEVPVIPLYSVSDAPAVTILDIAAIVGVDLLILGGSHRGSFVKLLKGNVVTDVARDLPPSIKLLIYG